MKTDEKVYDITIIGGGTAGLFTAFYAGMRNCTVKIIESLPQLGGQLCALYPEKYIYDVAGFPKIRAQELVDNLTEQMNVFPNTVCLGQEVQELKRKENGNIMLTTEKEIHYSKTVIITAGNGAFQPRLLKVKDAGQYEEKNLHYFIDDMNKFKGKNVAIFGGGDSAVDWALMLEPIAKNVSIIHRRKEFRAHESSIDQLRNSSVKIRTPYVPIEIIGDENAISHIVLEEPRTDNRETIKLDECIVNYGFVSTLGPIKKWGLEIEKNSIVVNTKLETNIPGVYAAGDICTYPGKVKLIATGFGDAPTAVSNAKAYIDPKTRLQPKHSTAIFSE